MSGQGHLHTQGHLHRVTCTGSPAHTQGSPAQGELHPWLEPWSPTRGAAGGSGCAALAVVGRRSRAGLSPCVPLGVTVSPQVQAGLGAQSSTAPGSLLGFSSSPHLPCSEGVVSVLRAPAGLHPWMEQSLPVLCCWNRAVKHPDRILLPLPPCPSGWVTSVPQRSLAGWAQDL